MISLYPNPVVYPVNAANLPTIVRQSCIQPLAFIPLTEEEQVSTNWNKIDTPSNLKGALRNWFNRGCDFRFLHIKIKNIFSVF